MRNRRKTRLRGILAALAVAFCAGAVVAGLFMRGDPPRRHGRPAGPGFGKVFANATLEGFVEKAVDGDTVWLSNGESVRYIGIDAPERDEPFYREAKDLNARLVEGKRVVLKTDGEARDAYGRLLANVSLTDGGDLINVEIVRRGLAYAYIHVPNDSHARAVIAAQKEARAAKRGLWKRKVKLEKEYRASAKSSVFHRPRCDSAGKIAKKNLVEFGTREEALDTGRAPCQHCAP
ncbi:MAG: thermonuclease family protein [Planctomycetota bacterium]